MHQENNWQAIRKELISILKDAELYEKRETCFLSAYQLAVLLNKQNKSLVKNSTSPKNIGGKGEGIYNSLSQYIANSLSRDINNGGSLEGCVEHKYFNIEGLEQFSFLDEKGTISQPSNKCFSMFRYIKEPIT